MKWDGWQGVTEWEGEFQEQTEQMEKKETGKEWKKETIWLFERENIQLEFNLK